jgi:hypothetical protein
VEWLSLLEIDGDGVGGVGGAGSALHLTEAVSSSATRATASLFNWESLITPRPLSISSAIG